MTVNVPAETEESQLIEPATENPSDIGTNTPTPAVKTEETLQNVDLPLPEEDEADLEELIATAAKHVIMARKQR